MTHKSNRENKPPVKSALEYELIINKLERIIFEYKEALTEIANSGSDEYLIASDALDLFPETK